MNIFICHAREDESWRKKVVQTLRPLVRERKIAEHWDETLVKPGEDRRATVNAAMDAADVALLLVSRAFCASDDCIEWQVPRLRNRKIRIIPILVSACAWDDLEALRDLVPFPPDRRPLHGRKDANQLLAALVKEILHARIAAPRVAGNAPRIQVARLPRTGKDLFGREGELKALGAAWENPAVHVVAFSAFGGSGKTALVNSWLASLAPSYGGAERVFGWSFYSQGTRQGTPASSDEFLDQALRFFDGGRAEGHNAWERAEILATAIRRRRTILILDGIEPLQDASDGRVRDVGLSTLLAELAAQMNGLCIVTTRPPFRELDNFSSTVPVIDLAALSPSAGCALLASRGVYGDPEELEMASREYHGHGLALTLLGSYVGDALEGDIRRRREVKLLDEGIPGVRHARSVMRSYEAVFSKGLERDILRITGLFDRPADTACVQALRRAPSIKGMTESLVGATEPKLNQTLARLRRSGLLLDTADLSLDAHPLVREYFAERLETESPLAARAAHNCLYEHLRESSPALPDTLTAMQPLFQAIRHGCRAERRRDALRSVFMRRIRHGDNHYSFNVLGAVAADLAALWEFFDGDWTRPHPDFAGDGDCLLLNEAGHGLLALGRTRQSIPCFERSRAFRIGRRDWLGAATPAYHLAEALAFLGTLSAATREAREAAEIAERSGDIDARPMNHSFLGWVLFLSGDSDQAEASFQRAERIQMEGTVFSPRLYSLAGAQYCELLLETGRADEALARAELSIRHLSRRIISRGGKHLLSDGLDHLTIARARAMRGERELARSEFSLALATLKGAGRLFHVAAALLASAEFYGREDPARAMRELETAMRIATRAEFRMLECDAHILATRLSLDRGDPDSARISLSRAQEVASACGYGRGQKLIDKLR